MIETCLFGAVIARDYSLVQTAEFVTRNIVVKAEDAKKHEWMPQRSHFLLKFRMGSQME